MAHVYPAFDAYLASDRAKSATQWQIATLCEVRFPPGTRPTVATYEQMQGALETVACDESPKQHASVGE